jgi:hypothetical protein
MSTIGTLSVKITGDSSGLDKSLKDSQASIKKFGLAATAAVTAAAGAFAVMVRNTINSMDQMGKASERLGVTVNRLSELKFQAEQAGVTFDELQGSIRRLSRNMVEAAEGNERSVQAFQALNISVRDSNGQMRDTYDVLGDVAEAFQKMDNGAQKVALSQQLMRNTSIVTMLNQGREGMERSAETARRLGIVYSEDLAKSAAQFNDSLNVLYKNMEALTIFVANKTLPTLNNLLSRLNLLREASLFTVADLRPDQINDPIAAIDSLIRKREELADKIEHETNRIQNARTAQSPLRLREMQKELRLTEDRIDALQKLKAQQDAITMPEMVVGGMAPELKSKITETRDELGEFIEDIWDAYSAYEQFIGQITGSTENELEKQRMAFLEKALDVGRITQEQFEDYSRQVMAMNKNNLTQMGEFAIQAARNIQNILGDTLYDFLSGKFESIGNSFVTMLKRMTANLMASQIGALLFGSFDKTGTVGGIAASIGQALGGMFTASAGVSSMGTTAGGAGAVAFPVSLAEGGYTGHGGKYEPAGVVHRGEYVLNAASTRRIGLNTLDKMNKGFSSGGYAGGGMGGGVNINIKNEAGADGYNATAQARQNTNGGLDIDVLIKRAVAADIRDNGSLAQQMANTFGLRRSM